MEWREWTQNVLSTGWQPLLVLLLLGLTFFIGLSVGQEKRETYFSYRFVMLPTQARYRPLQGVKVLSFKPIKNPMDTVFLNLLMKEVEESHSRELILGYKGK